MKEAATKQQIIAMAKEAKPVIKAWLEAAEKFAGFRDAAREKGIDWASLKALIKAQIQDELDEKSEGKRVKAIIDQAITASAHADFLGVATNITEKNISRDGPSEPAASARAAGIDRPKNDDRENPGHAQPETGHIKSTVSIAAASPHVAERPERSEQAPSPELLKVALTACTVQTVDAGEIPACIDVRHRLVRA